MIATFSFDQFGDDAKPWKIVRGGRPKCGKKLKIKPVSSARLEFEPGTADRVVVIPDTAVRSVEIVGEIKHRGTTIWVVRESAQ